MEPSLSHGASGESYACIFRTMGFTIAPKKYTRCLQRPFGGWGWGFLAFGYMGGSLHHSMTCLSPRLWWFMFLCRHY
ncbi:hypothetical protein BV22DRAFT_596062 [Leucogyrophana mollusca]|uniref:Uncharacterized protein n=1 Tax=Leucogyrophana mollusca TaxID=85980 RepID=A0ACB8BES1_9AGAM|nr:hypothetical protein BV22DRAFT_596062 [Leucogyrophana mollusca]